MEQQRRVTSTTLIFTLVMLLSWAGAAIRRCGNCGLNPVPYPLSTGPDCGDLKYKIRCTAGTLWLDAVGGSSYMVKSIDPKIQRIVIRPASIARSACVSTDFHSGGIHLNETLPFKLTTRNTVFLYNCTDAVLKLHAHARMDCSRSSACHGYIVDRAENGGSCKRVGLCCSFRTGGLQSEYTVRVHVGECGAYQSFVNMDMAVAPPGKRWPEPGVEVEWVPPEEPVCKAAVDCKELLNSKCLADATSVGQFRCFCNAGFKWDPMNGLCQRIQEINCGKHGKGKHCKHRKKKKTVLLAGMAVSIGAILLVCAVFLMAVLHYKKTEKSKTNTHSQNNSVKRKDQILSTTTKASGSGVSVSVSVSVSARIFTIRDIKKATNNFSQDNLIGSGAFGEVFQATFEDGATAAIKRARLGNTKALDQTLNEVRILCQVNHRHLVRLLGCCIDQQQQPLLIYEFVPNGTLFDHLHTHRFDQPLKWPHRLKIAHQTAQAISYLHSSASPPIYHRDIKSSNILLDAKFDAKVSDFGLSRLVEIAEENKSHILTSAQGTLGYLDPEYYRNFQLTDKSDVYSFGVVLLEMVTCKKAIDFSREEGNVNLVMYGKKMIKEDRFLEIVDPMMKEEGSVLELETMKCLGYVAMACLDEQRQNRPSMKQVSDEIEHIISIVTSENSNT